MKVNKLLNNCEGPSAITTDLTATNRYRLAELPPGSNARMVEFASGIPGDYKTKLQAYGVTPGNAFSLCQLKPVTVIQIEHTELAFEANLAEAIIVEKM